MWSRAPAPSGMAPRTGAQPFQTAAARLQHPVTRKTWGLGPAHQAPFGKARGCSVPCTLPDRYRGEGLQRLTDAGSPSQDQRVVLG